MVPGDLTLSYRRGSNLFAISQRPQANLVNIVRKNTRMVQRVTYKQRPWAAWVVLLVNRRKPCTVTEGMVLLLSLDDLVENFGDGLLVNWSSVLFKVTLLLLQRAVVITGARLPTPALPAELRLLRIHFFLPNRSKVRLLEIDRKGSMTL